MSVRIMDEAAAKQSADGHAECSAPKIRAGIVRAGHLLATSSSYRPVNDRIRRSMLPQAIRASVPGGPATPHTAPAACPVRETRPWPACRNPYRHIDSLNRPGRAPPTGDAPPPGIAIAVRPLSPGSQRQEADSARGTRQNRRSKERSILDYAGTPLRHRPPSARKSVKYDTRVFLDGDCQKFNDSLQSL